MTLFVLLAFLISGLNELTPYEVIKINKKFKSKLERIINNENPSDICKKYKVDAPFKRPKKLSEEQKNKMLQPDDLGETIAFLCQMPKHVCINELTISPTWHRRYIADLGIEEL